MQDKRQLLKWIFIGGLVVITLFINLHFSNLVKSKAAKKAAIQAAAEADRNARALKAAKEAEAVRNAEISASNRVVQIARNARIAAAEEERFLTRYLNARQAKKPGVKMLAIAVIDETKSPNRTVENALASHFKGNATEAVSSFFTQAFYSDGLFDNCLRDSGDVFTNLHLRESLDGLLLAQYKVEYSTSEVASQTMVKATINLDISLVPISTTISGSTPSFIATGVGFDRGAARQLAEERLVKQISDDTKMSLN